MPSIISRRAPGIARAVARPPEGLDQLVRGAVDDQGRGGDVAQLGGAVARGEMAPSWRRDRRRGRSRGRTWRPSSVAQVVVVALEAGRADDVEQRGGSAM